jgi:hypothetical protein
VITHGSPNITAREPRDHKSTETLQAEGSISFIFVVFQQGKDKAGGNLKQTADIRRRRKWNIATKYRKRGRRGCKSWRKIRGYVRDALYTRFSLMELYYLTINMYHTTLQQVLHLPRVKCLQVLQTSIPIDTISGTLPGRTEESHDPPPRK